MALSTISKKFEKEKNKNFQNEYIDFFFFWIEFLNANQTLCSRIKFDIFKREKGNKY